jgi:hypothetical protein
MSIVRWRPLGQWLMQEKDVPTGHQPATVFGRTTATSMATTSARVNFRMSEFRARTVRPLVSFLPDDRNVENRSTQAEPTGRTRGATAGGGDDGGPGRPTRARSAERGIESPGGWSISGPSVSCHAWPNLSCAVLAEFEAPQSAGAVSLPGAPNGSARPARRATPAGCRSRRGRGAGPRRGGSATPP